MAKLFLFLALSQCLATQLALTEAFQSPPQSPRFVGSTALLARRKLLVKERRTFDPMGFAEMYENNEPFPLSDHHEQSPRESVTESQALALASAALMVPQSAHAASAAYDPSTFVPVCPTSDGFYRAIQASTQAVVGEEAFREYGPLIAGGLLRVRLELCVVESFFNEAVGPFIAKNGLSWVLPLHETVETFLAGTVFAFAATFILIGSTKIITVAVTYTDFLLGVPSRLFGGFFYDRALGKPVTLDIGFGPFKTRLIGPPEEEEEVKVDIMSKGPASIAVVGLSGAVKFFGEALRVR